MRAQNPFWFPPNPMGINVKRRKDNMKRLTPGEKYPQHTIRVFDGDTLEIGGTTFTIGVDGKVGEIMNCRGEGGFFTFGNICINTATGSVLPELSFVHEITHAIGATYLANTLSEAQVDSISQGFLQVLKQFGIRFTVMAGQIP